MARAIAVGIPPDVVATLDRGTGLSNGQAVPEADRAVHTKRLGFAKQKSIPAIPIVDEDGEVIGERPNIDRFGQAVVPMGEEFKLSEELYYPNNDYHLK